MIFDIKKRLKTGWKFSKLFGLREAFFRRGFTTADLKIDGKVPVSSLVLCAQSTTKDYIRAEGDFCKEI